MHQSNRSFYLELSLDCQNWPVQYAYIYQNCSYNSGMYHDCPVGYVPELFLQFLYVRFVGTILVLNELLSNFVVVDYNSNYDNVQRF